MHILKNKKERNIVSIASVIVFAVLVHVSLTLWQENMPKQREIYAIHYELITGSTHMGLWCLNVGEDPVIHEDSGNFYMVSGERILKAGAIHLTVVTHKPSERCPAK